jgi:cysteinyl-tRNA synthetase
LISYIGSKKRVAGVSETEDSDFRAELLTALSDDLNISKALSALDERVATANETIDKNPKDKTAKAQAANISSITAEILGIGASDANLYFQQGVGEEQKAAIEEMIQKRTEAKKAKDFAAADTIRDELKSIGVELMDTPAGTVWEKVLDA